MKLLQFASCLASAMLAFNLGAQTKTNQTVAVKVQDDSGKPVSGATVEIYSFVQGASESPTVDKSKAVVTDGDGMAQATVAGTLGQVVARKTGMALASAFCGPSTPQPIILTLSQATTVSGTVVDESDKPVSDAKVCVSIICRTRADGRSYSSMSTDFNEDLLSTRTGTDGRFRIEGLPTNSSVALIVRKSGKAQVQPARDRIAPETMDARAGQQDIRLKVQPAGAIEGKLLIPEEGKNLPVYFSLRNAAPNTGGRRPQLQVGRPPRTRASADGSFRFDDLAAGTYQILTTFGTNKLPEWVTQRQIISVEAGKITGDVKVTAVKGGVLEATVLSTAGHKPVQGAMVTAAGQDSAVGGATGENGLYAMRLLPGQYRVLGSIDGSQSKDVTAQIEEGKTNHVELELASPPQLSGTVRDTNGAPVAGIEVRIHPNWSGASNVKTDTNGHFQIRFVSRNSSSSSQREAPFVMVRDRDRNLAAARTIEEGTESYDLQLAAALVVTGRVLDEKGKPLTNAAVNVIAWGGNMGSWMDSDRPSNVDAEGRYEIGALPAGRRYSVSATAKGYGSASTKREEIEINRFEFEPIILRVADKQIAGVVVDSDNNPVPGVMIFISGDGQPNSTTRTDDKGRFAINEVCDGIINISASAPSVGANSYGNARGEGGATNIVITLGQQAGLMRFQSRRVPLVGNPLPDLTIAGISADLIQTNKQLLICLFDPEQRPSRRVVRLLGEQHDAIKQKGVTVVGISAALTTADALKEWKQSNQQPFPVGGVTERTDKTTWILSTEKFPWLILTDTQGRVKAEGFDLEELDAKLK